MTVHSEHPFATPSDERDPVRRFRGRLVAPVTVFTTGAGSERTGITVSSVLVVEGEPALISGVVGAGSDFVDLAGEGFVVHILAESERSMADVFAGIRPSPGGVFAGRDTEETEWGPRLVEVSDWAGCRTERIEPVGDQVLVTGAIRHLQVSDLARPLAYFRGGYRRVGETTQ